MSKRHVNGSVLAVALVLAQSGCGSPNQPVAVKGVVTLDGKPVPGATVSFLPEGERGRPANALTDSGGAFRLTTFQKGDGAVPGQYRVIVTKTEAKIPDGPRWTEYWDDQHKRKRQPVQYYGMLWASARKPSKSLLPTVYGDAGETPLQCQVPPGGKVTLELRTTRRP